MAHFEFVVTSGTPSQRATTKTRSHAVKSGLQRKCKDKEANSSKDSQLVIRQATSLKSRFRVSVNPSNTPTSKTTNKKSTENTCSTEATKGSARNSQRERRTQSSQHLGLYKSPSQARLDPFDVFPIDQPHGVDNLIKFCECQLQIDMTNMTNTPQFSPT